MRYFGNIKLPLQRVEKVNGSDIEILDYLMDMHIPQMSEFMSNVHKQDIPSMMVLTQGQYGFVGIFFYRPPDIWMDFDFQKYQLYLAPNFGLLIHYWVDRRMKTTDLFENQVTTKVIDYLEPHVKKLQQNQSVSHTG